MARTESIIEVVAILFAVPTCAFGRSSNDVLAMFKPIRPMNFTPEQMKLLEDNRLTQEMWPFLNITAVEELYGKKRDNESDVITDEDVADIPDDDGHPMPNTVHYDGQKTTVTISTEGAELLFQHWIDQAVSGLMSAIATKKLEVVGRRERAAHKKCTRRSTSIKEHAQCVVELMDDEAKYQQRKKKFEAMKNNSALRSLRRSFKKKFLSNHGTKKAQRVLLEQLGNSRTLKSSSMNKLIGPFRMRAKRSTPQNTNAKIVPVNRDRYDLIDKNQRSPMGVIAKNLLRQVRRLKNKDENDGQHWKETVAQLQMEGGKLRKRRKMLQLLHRHVGILKNALRDQAIIRRIMKKKIAIGSYDKDNDVEKLMKEKKEQEAPDYEKMMRIPVNLVREAVKLTVMLDGGNITDFDKKILEILSPRLFPVVPEEDVDSKVKALSPSLFALHDEGHGVENETSLVRAMSLFGNKENDAWLNLIMEASGVSDALDALKGENNGRFQLRDAALRDSNRSAYLTKENVTTMLGEEEGLKIEIFERLQRSLTNEQLLAMNATGYAVMNGQQLNMVYGPSSPYNDSETLEQLSKIRPEEVPAIIEKTIHGLAKETIKFKVQRRRAGAAILSPFLFGSIVLDPEGASIPVVLSPILLTQVILSPAVLGALILSPLCLVPIVLGPRLLFPVVLSPIALTPVILTPLVMDPVIMSPGVLLPFIFSPQLLSPFVLMPVAMVPFVFSPFALTPFIYIPHTMVPMILSPFVLSPIVCSPPYISAFVLSPYAFSPIIKSTGKYFTTVLSPSWMS